jgi:hypothetical protein
VNAVGLARQPADDDPVGLGLVLVPQLALRLPVDLPDALEPVAGVRLPELALDRGRVVGERQLLRQFALVLGVPAGVLVGHEDPVYLPVLDGEVEPLGLPLQVEAITSFSSAAISSVQPMGLPPWYRSAGEAGSRASV